uniref:Uncharacterized protein n=1 Tax=Arundo donax TaxID=35708 RepID=A0A0A8Y144_ARUDO
MLFSILLLDVLRVDSKVFSIAE